jgi:hypothetical protein
MAMSQKHVVLVAVGAFVLGVAIVACSDDPNRPPATSSGGSVTGSTSGGSGSTVDGSTADGSTSSGDGGGSSSGGSSGTSSGFIETGLRATVGGTAAKFEVGTTAVKQNNGFLIELSGKDAAGNELKLTLTSDTVATAGAYNCSGGQGARYGIITYTVTGGESWSAVASGACTIAVQQLDSQANGFTQGTFTATLQKGGSPDKSLTGGEFRLQF